MKDDLAREFEDGSDHTKKVECFERMDLLMRVYAPLSGTTDKTIVLSDVLTDLRHWADIAGVDWDDAVSRAERHFTAETDDEPDDATG